MLVALSTDVINMQYIKKQCKKHHKIDCRRKFSYCRTAIRLGSLSTYIYEPWTATGSRMFSALMRIIDF